MSNVRMWPVESADALSPLQGRHAPADTSSEELIHFGRSSLIVHHTHILQDAGRPVRLGSRALEILLLVENAGRFASNADIVLRVWPRNVIVDGNLRVHIAGLHDDRPYTNTYAWFLDPRDGRIVMASAFFERSLDARQACCAVAPLSRAPAAASAAGRSRRSRGRSSRRRRIQPSPIPEPRENS